MVHMATIQVENITIGISIEDNVNLERIELLSRSIFL